MKTPILPQLKAIAANKNILHETKEDEITLWCNGRMLTYSQQTNMIVFAEDDEIMGIAVHYADPDFYIKWLMYDDD